MQTLNLKYKKTITILVVLITILAGAASLTGIASDAGPGEYKYRSIRGQEITIYGQGIYKHMSADVAIQGIAQDYITLFAGIPLLLLGLYFFRKGSARGLLVLSGTLMYFLVTYLFYTAMAMYNFLFLAYVSLLGASFFGLALALISFDFQNIKELFPSEKLIRYSGLFLAANSIMIALLWLSVVVPPLLDGSIYPQGLQHYTTLIVQGLDLGLLLPLGVVIGYSAFKRNIYGYLFTAVYLVFLSLLMLALTSKIAFMAKAGENVIPVIFIMPTLFLIATSLSFSILKNKYS